MERQSTVWGSATHLCVVSPKYLVWLQIQELLKTQTALHNLIKRNRDLPVEVLAARNKEAQKGPTALQLPFILIQVGLPYHLQHASSYLPLLQVFELHHYMFLLLICHHPFRLPPMSSFVSYIVRELCVPVCCVHACMCTIFTRDTGCQSACITGTAFSMMSYSFQVAGCQTAVIGCTPLLPCNPVQLQDV